MSDSTVPFHGPGRNAFNHIMDIELAQPCSPSTLKSCFQAEDVGCREGGLPGSRKQKTSDCVLWQGASPPTQRMSPRAGEGHGAGRRWGDRPNKAWAQLPLPSSWWAFLISAAQSLLGVNWLFFPKKAK